ncbi:hypothetical protein [uncultured Pseudomonas sp.]|uniref:hypothetical protein n=1 Tax=uncultured Pseudomonas sp. TaxID=114707 RepID=UPI00260BBD5E|nr:hypothetical protein [uncultured Pseudomonas sp.]
MVRIRGQIGAWPVDLTVELDAQDWAQLAQHISLDTPPVEVVPERAAAATPAAGDALWQTTLELLRKAGQVEGPHLLAQLTALAGGEAAGKRLLVRLRHCTQVRMEAGVDAPIYHWIG